MALVLNPNITTKCNYERIFLSFKPILNAFAPRAIKAHLGGSRTNIISKRKNIFSERMNIISKRKNIISKRKNISSKRMNIISKCKNITKRKNILSVLGFMSCGLFLSSTWLA